MSLPARCETEIPEWLARLGKTLFEGLPDDRAKDFRRQFLDAIPVWVNLEPVKWKFCVFLLNENIERVLLLDIDTHLKEQVASAIRECLALHERAIVTGVFDCNASQSARSAARSAAWSAAGSAAWSAAEIGRASCRERV